jgi:hypothetical protein
VVADWKAAARDIVKRDWGMSERIPDEDWNKVRAKSRFYRDLPIKAGAHDLVNYCRDLKADGLIDDLRFLTALPHDYSVPFAAYDKVLWAMERFERIPVLFGPFSGDKWRHCQPGDILIDDRTSNCEEWIRAGGYAHIYRTWESCQTWLGDHFAGTQAARSASA